MYRGLREICKKKRNNIKRKKKDNNDERYKEMGRKIDWNNIRHPLGYKGAKKEEELRYF